MLLFTVQSCAPGTQEMVRDPGEISMTGCMLDLVTPSSLDHKVLTPLDSLGEGVTPQGRPDA